jgi:sec-independent protein translocase protein TatA
MGELRSHLFRRDSPMPNLRPWEILIIVALIVLLFGAKRLPDAARGLGRSLRIFKAETKAMHDDDASSDHPAGDAKPTPPALGTTDSGTGDQQASARHERTET